MLPDARIKDCVCVKCAKALGYVMKDKVVGVWIGECEFCGKRKPLTSLCHDWRKKGADNGK